MSYTHLTRDDRIRLAALLRAGFSYRKCAEQIGVSPPAISYEVNNNGSRKNYNPHTAQRNAQSKRHSANQCHRKWQEDNPETQLAILLLKIGWSPDQISGRSKLELNEQLFSSATIYNNVNTNKELSLLLPRKHNKYRRTKAGNNRKRQRGELSDKRSIDARPGIVSSRGRIGDWEGDTIIGKEKTARILTHVERRTGYLLANLIYDASAEQIRFKSSSAFMSIPQAKKRTSTYDNGSEFADWELTEQETGLEIYFATPYHSWERGTNENTNGLIRRYFPKGTYFSKISIEQLEDVVGAINYRPRKRLGYRTPHEKFWGVKLRTLM